MDDAFKDARKIEEFAREELLPWLNVRCYRLEIPDRKIFIQKHWGDFIAKVKKYPRSFGNYAGAVIGLELKAELEDRYGNFFLEMFSNKRLFLPGWMLTCFADFLLYYFCETGDLYLMNFKKLKEWAFYVDQGSHSMRITKYDFKEQDKRQQRNDTWGYCVPKRDLTRESFVKLITRENRNIEDIEFIDVFDSDDDNFPL